jgi:hypothetical protein
MFSWHSRSPWQLLTVPWLWSRCCCGGGRFGGGTTHAAGYFLFLLISGLSGRRPSGGGGGRWKLATLGAVAFVLAWLDAKGSLGSCCWMDLPTISVISGLAVRSWWTRLSCGRWKLSTLWSGITSVRGIGALGFLGSCCGMNLSALSVYWFWSVNFFSRF